MRQAAVSVVASFGVWWHLSGGEGGGEKGLEGVDGARPGLEED